MASTHLEQCVVLIEQNVDYSTEKKKERSNVSRRLKLGQKRKHR